MRKEKGIIALISLLVIAAVTLAIGISISLLSISEINMGLKGSKSGQAFHLTDSCLEEALMRLKRDENYSGGNLNVTGGSCNIIVEAAGSQKTINITADLDNIQRKIKAVTNVTVYGGRYYHEILSWEEIY